MLGSPDFLHLKTIAFAESSFNVLIVFISVSSFAIEEDETSNLIEVKPQFKADFSKESNVLVEFSKKTDIKSPSVFSLKLPLSAIENMFDKSSIVQSFIDKSRLDLFRHCKFEVIWNAVAIHD